MIVEVVKPDGTRTWRRLDALPLTIGRGFANDLILDDPYVDARHARIALDAEGLRIHDLGSVNGLTAGGARLEAPLEIQPGLEIRVGRTRLRIHDADEAVAPALIDVPPEAVPAPAASQAATRPPHWMPKWATTANGQLMLAGAAAVLAGAWSWVTSYEDAAAGGDVLSGMMAFMAGAALWAALWAVASRATVRRFNYLAHFAVAAAIAVVGFAWSAAEEWLAFFFPDAAALEVASTLFLVVILCALIAGHLALASTMPSRRRWRMAAAVTGTVLGVLGLAALAANDEFTDVPTFSETLKPVRADLIPAATVEDFAAEMADLRRDVDKMVRKD